MLQRSISVGLLCVLIVAGQCIACTNAQASESGVRGKVSMSPSCPGPQKINQEACTTPFAEAKVQLRNSAGKLVRNVIAGGDGIFTIHAPAGVYALHVEVEGMYPRCEVVEVTVQKGHMGQADIACDSGMR